MPIDTPNNKEKKVLANTRIIEVLDFVVANKIQGITDETNFLRSIAFNSTRNLKLIRAGAQSFQIEHIENIVTIYGVSADFILNKNCYRMFMDLGNETPMFRLKVAAKEVEIYLKELEKG